MAGGVILRHLVQAWREGAEHYTRPLGSPGGQLGGRSGRPNPWPKCPSCYRRNPSLCDVAEEGAEPCGRGIRCGCCDGPHRAPKKSQEGDE